MRYEKGTVELRPYRGSTRLPKVIANKLWQLFSRTIVTTVHRGADRRRSVFPPLMNCLKSIQDLCQSNFLPALASCTQISSMHVMYRPNDGACTYACMQLESNKANEARSLQPVEVDSTIYSPFPPFKVPLGRWVNWVYAKPCRSRKNNSVTQIPSTGKMS